LVARQFAGDGRSVSPRGFHQIEFFSILIRKDVAV
jgi:hypothetical protein